MDVYVDDVKLNLKDANGNPVEAFVYNGTTYLPVRAVGEAVGKVVQWEPSTSSVYLGKHDSATPAVWLKDLDYFTGEEWHEVATAKDNLGNVHTNVIFARYGETRDNTYKIDGQYSQITGCFFQMYEARSNSRATYLEIYGDHQLLYSAEMNGGIEPIHFDVNISGILELEIKYYGKTYGNDNAMIGECGLWT